MKCERCQYLETALENALLRLEDANARAARATDLMMKGETLREKMTLNSILAGDTIEDKKARMVYILTGKRL